MNCTNCGNEMPMGSMACPYCGTPAPVDMGMQQQFQQPYQQPYQQGAPMDMGMQQQFQQPYQAAPAMQYQTAPTSNKKNLIIGLSIGAVAIVAIVLLLVFVVFKGGDVDGTYVCNYYGMEVELEIDGDEFTMSMSYLGESEELSGSCEVDGDEVLLTYDGETVACDYDAKEGTIDFDGMIFEKE